MSRQNQNVARTFAAFLKQAGVNFTILGNEEACCGDPARRMGHELSCDMIARGNIVALKDSTPKWIVTACPRCFNAIGNEYQKLNGEFDVIHHTQLLKELVSRAG